jgi:S1-C subfamily serine protease
VQEPNEIYIWQDGQQKGPYTASAFGGSIRIGSITPETPAWTRRDPTWRSARELLKSIGQPHETATVTQPPETQNPGVVRMPIARSHRPTHKRDNGLRAFLIVVVTAAALLLVVIALVSRKSRTNLANANSRPEGPEPTIIPSPEVNEISGTGRWATTVEEAENCVLMARHASGSGTAFIAQDADQFYVYTNVHVASSGPIQFIDFRGKSRRVSNRGEVVADSESLTMERGIDVVRFPLLESPDYWLRFANRETIEKKPTVWTLGDSGGERILKTLEGRVTGVGPSKIEVDCQFVQGNSGGPIVTANGEVVGIASYMITDKSIWAKGTVQEVRRMAWIPGGNPNWIETSIDQLEKEEALVRNCYVTTGMLWLVSELATSESGFLIPEDLPEETLDFLSNTTRGHALRDGLDEISQSLAVSSGGTQKSPQQTHREFIRYFESCGAYQKSQLERAAKEVHSSFWKKQLDEKMPAYEEILDAFSYSVSKYRSEGRIGQSLKEF